MCFPGMVSELNFNKKKSSFCPKLPILLVRGFVPPRG
jgi:hypothetical protein